MDARARDACADIQAASDDLKPSLGQNSRARTFILAPGAIEKFDEDIGRFIKKFVERYCCKYLHTNLRCS
jgi:type IV secretory pathway VirB9-like protein